MKPYIVVGLVFICLLSCKKDKTPDEDPVFLQLVSVSVGPIQLSLTERDEGLATQQPIVIRFSQVIDRNSVENNISLFTSDDEILADLTFSYLDNDRTISAMPTGDLDENTNYTISIGDGLKGVKNEVFTGLDVLFKTINPPLEVNRAMIDDINVIPGERVSDIGFTPTINLYFSEKIDKSMVEEHTSIYVGSFIFNFTVSQLSDSVVAITLTDNLPYFRKIGFLLSPDLGDDLSKEFSGYSFEFYTMVDETPKFPTITDEELMTLVQRYAFKYFWDFGHPVSGLSRERNTSYETVTSGGSGFGIMAIPVGIERGFITRQQGVERVEMIVDFLATAERFHGAWSHWLNGTTGKVIPFSANDNGGDLVETSYLAMGLITIRQYLDDNDAGEAIIIDKINTLLSGIEWDWYTQGENSLTWHWSPDYLFVKNMKIRGWNEALITYIVAASSSTHTITREVYEQGWGGGSHMVNENDFYGITLPLGPDYGGPLFFEQYTFLGVDPANLSDQYADYFEQAVNHSLINREHCIVNPYNYIGYSELCWGLTASDGDRGYSAHSPTNDRGVITPTAAISSIPFTPNESLEAMKYFYYVLGDRVWGQYGFYDAFNVTMNWYSTSNIAIDQGPILLMIENYRTGLLWNLFMSAPEISAALTKLGFTY